MSEPAARVFPGGGGNSGKSGYRRGAGQTTSIKTQSWVQDKIADGDIAGGMASGHSGTSIFDPVLCEVAYRWFAPPGGLVLDPFAGGSVRGIVATMLGRRYVGIDLSLRQIDANRAQAARICGEDAQPEWFNGDSEKMGEFLPADLEADFVFSCPPYMDLEIYSDDPRDLSNLPPGEFEASYQRIIAGAVDRLKRDRFACFVVGEVRDKEAGGRYRGFVPMTIHAFERAGAHFYNEAILVTAAGSLPIRTARQFEISRKLGKTHQNVLVFVKGDPRKATEAVGPVEFAEPEPEAQSEAEAQSGEQPGSAMGDEEFGTPL